MNRVYTRPKGGAGLLDNRIGQPMWTKPGTPMRRALKGTIAYMKAERPVHRNQREQGRYFSRPGTLVRKWNNEDAHNRYDGIPMIDRRAIEASFYHL